MHLLLFETTRYRGFDVVTELAREGVRVTFVTADLEFYRDRPGFAGHADAHRTLTIPATDPAGLLRTVRAELHADPPDGVLALTDDAVLPAARLAAGLGLPHEDPSVLELVRDKGRVRARLDAAGLGSVRWGTADSPAELARVAERIGYPVVVKPASGSGSVGVQTVWNGEQAATVDGFPVLVEQRLSGREVSAELLVHDGRVDLLGFAERLPPGPGVTAELGGHFPTRFDGSGAAAELARSAVRAVGLSHGGLHLEMMCTPGGPELVEINPRPAGHVVLRQMSVALDRSVALDLAAVAAGRAPEPLGEPVAALALRHLTSRDGGVLGHVATPPEIPGVLELEVGPAVGERVRPLRTNRDRFGHVLTVAGTVDGAVALADRATDALGLRIDPDPRTDVDTGGAQGPHLLVLLGPDTPVPGRILVSLAAVTERLSVLWCGDPSAAGPLRAAWAARFDGTWRATPDPAVATPAAASPAVSAPSAASSTAASVAAVAAELCGGDVRAVCPVGGEPEGAVDAVRRALGLPIGRPGHPAEPPFRASTPPRPEPSELPPPAGSSPPAEPSARAESALRAGLPPAAGAGGAAAIGLMHDGHPVHVAVFGIGPDGIAFPGPPAPDLHAAVAAAALPDGPFTAWPDASGWRVRPGLTAPLLEVHDAVADRDLVAVAASAQLGAPVPVRCRGAALRRALPVPEGRFRVLSVPRPDELRACPDVSAVDVRVAEGTVTTAGEHPEWLTYVVAGPDAGHCRSRAGLIEDGLPLVTERLDAEHVLVLDRIGGATLGGVDGEPVLDPARYDTTVLSGAAPASWAAGTPPGRLLCTDVFDPAAVRTLADAVHRNRPVGRVAAAAERLLGPAAELRERWGLPGIRPPESAGYTDKLRMKRLAAAAGLRYADGLLLRHADELRELFGRHGAVVLKPRSASGSNGVSVCAGEDAVEEWLRSAFVPERYLAEELVPGDMCHIDALVTGGEVLAWDVSRYLRHTLAHHRGLPLSSRTVADPGVRDAAREMLDAVVQGWRIRDQVLHVEAFEAPGGLVFCELAGRPGGAGVIEAFRLTRGYDLRHAKIRLDAGAGVRGLRTDPVAAHAGWTVHYSPGGRLVEYRDDAVAALAAVRSVTAAVGDTVAVSRYSGTGIGKYVFGAPTEPEVLALIARAERDVSIRFDAGPAGVVEHEVSG